MTEDGVVGLHGNWHLIFRACDRAGAQLRDRATGAYMPLDGPLFGIMHETGIMENTLQIALQEARAAGATPVARKIRCAQIARND